MQKIVCFLICIVCLSACDNQTRDKIKDMISGSGNPPATAAAESLYCYRTIGKVNCYTEPLKGQEANRLIGYDGTSPRTTSGSGALRP
jgi:hypothetical protein